MKRFLEVLSFGSVAGRATPISIPPMRLTSILLLGFSLTLHASPLEPIPLWPGGAPGALGTNETDIPTLTAFLPEPAKATGAAIVICPGGGYGGLADHEGRGYAEWLAETEWLELF